MSRFNESVTNTTTNMAGGSAYKMSPELELVSAMLTTFLEDKFYESGKKRQDRITDLLTKVQPKFAAQATLFARNEYGMRSVSHIAAAELACKVKGEPWAQNFYDKVIHRPDDITEILAYYKASTKQKQSHAMRKGFAKALQRFDAYQLAKYRGEGKGVKLVDALNLTHPTPTPSLTKLYKDELRNENTFEAKLSQAGNADDKEAAKELAWSELLKSGRLGYFALLRNLRNIIEQAPDMVGAACEQLNDPVKIKKSLVLPFRFLTASEEVQKLAGKEAKQVLVALANAMDISIENIPKFDGNTLVAVDTSGSMVGWYNRGGAIEHAALFAAMLIRSNMADLMYWDVSAATISLNPADTTLTLAKTIVEDAKRRQGGTDINCLFNAAQGKYDRIIILTDEQSWAHNYSAPQALNKYKARTGANPFVYNWDLQGHGTLQFPENNVATLAGWSEKVFDIMKLVETDKRALVHKIESIEM